MRRWKRAKRRKEPLIQEAKAKRHGEETREKDMIKQLRSMLVEMALEQSQLADYELVSYFLVLLVAFGHECTCDAAVEVMTEHMLARFIEETHMTLSQRQFRQAFACIREEKNSAHGE